MIVIDLDDVSRCPVTGCCQRCENAVSDVQRYTAGTVLGVLCVELCATCAQEQLPSWSLGTVQRAVLEHCMHLRIDVDEMQSALSQEQASF